MKIIGKLFVLIVICFLPSKAQLSENDCVIFLGNSITAAGVRPDGYVTLVNKAIQKTYPKKHIKIIGAGVSGNRVPDCQKRLKSDVLKKKPTIVVIFIGINDVWHWENSRGTTKEKYKTGLNNLIKRINAVNARVILCTPTVIGEKFDGGNKYDTMLDEYSNISREVAKEVGVQLLDLRKEFIDYLKMNNSNNQSIGILTSDSVHLNKTGNRFLADLMLRALKVPVY